MATAFIRCVARPEGRVPRLARGLRRLRSLAGLRGSQGLRHPWGFDAARTIGRVKHWPLLVPVLAASVLGLPLVLGWAPKEMAMLAMTFLVSAITLRPGRTHLMQGAVRRVVFAAFVCLAFVP